MIISSSLIQRASSRNVQIGDRYFDINLPKLPRDSVKVTEVTQCGFRYASMSGSIKGEENFRTMEGVILGNHAFPVKVNAGNKPISEDYLDYILSLDNSLDFLR